MNRLYVIESTPTLTGANADHRFDRRNRANVEVCHARDHALLR